MLAIVPKGAAWPTCQGSGERSGVGATENGRSPSVPSYFFAKVNTIKLNS